MTIGQLTELYKEQNYNIELHYNKNNEINKICKIFKNMDYLYLLKINSFRINFSHKNTSTLIININKENYKKLTKKIKEKKLKTCNWCQEIKNISKLSKIKVWPILNYKSIYICNTCKDKSIKDNQTRWLNKKEYNELKTNYDKTKFIEKCSKYKELNSYILIALAPWEM